MAAALFEPRVGETVLWTAKPRCGPLRTTLTYVGGLLWLAFGIFAAAFTVDNLRKNGFPDTLNQQAINAIFYMLMPFVAAGSAAQCFLLPKRLRRTTYVVTDQRIGMIQSGTKAMLTWEQVRVLRRTLFGLGNGIYVYTYVRGEDRISRLFRSPWYTFTALTGTRELFRIAQSEWARKHPTL